MNSMRDEWFFRGDKTIPMTKEEIRAVSLAKLELSGSDRLWDIGSGTGSVSIDAAAGFPGIRVTAFEKDPLALELLDYNYRKAQEEGILRPGCISRIEGEAPGTFSRAEDLPTRAFIGGSGGHFPEILQALWERNPGIRVTANIITLETLQKLLEFTGARGISPDISLIQVTRAVKRGGSHLMLAGNPVYVVTFGGGHDQMV